MALQIQTYLTIHSDVKYGYASCASFSDSLKSSMEDEDFLSDFLIPQKSFPNGPLVKIDSESSAKKIFLRASKAL